MDKFSLAAEKYFNYLSITYFFFLTCCQVDSATWPTAQEVVEELIPIHQLHFWGVQSFFRQIIMFSARFSHLTNFLF